MAWIITIGAVGESWRNFSVLNEEIPDLFHEHKPFAVGAVLSESAMDRNF